MGLNFHQSSSPDHVIHKVKSKVKVKIKRLLKLYVPTKKVMADLESLNANGRLNVRVIPCQIAPKRGQFYTLPSSNLLKFGLWGDCGSTSSNFKF